MAVNVPLPNPAVPGGAGQPAQPLLVQPPGDCYPEFLPNTHAQDALIPPALALHNPFRGHNEYKLLIKAFYLTLEVIDENVDGVATSCIISSYLSMSAADFTAWKTAHPIAARYLQVPMDLYKILQVLLRPPPGQQHSQLFALMDGDDVNNILDVSPFAAGIAENAENFSFLVPRKWVQAGVDALIHQHQKGQKNGQFMPKAYVNQGQGHRAQEHLSKALGLTQQQD